MQVNQVELAVEQMPALNTLIKASVEPGTGFG